MNRKALNKTFILISNLKKNFSPLVYIKHFLAFGIETKKGETIISNTDMNNYIFWLVCQGFL